jgi:hypothetical protein
MDVGNVTELGLLALQTQGLPNWSDLPILDLLGSLTTESNLIGIGTKRRREISGCDLTSSLPVMYDARQLLCNDGAL